MQPSLHDGWFELSSLRRKESHHDLRERRLNARRCACNWRVGRWATMRVVASVATVDHRRPRMSRTPWPDAIPCPGPTTLSVLNGPKTPWARYWGRGWRVREEHLPVRSWTGCETQNRISLPCRFPLIVTLRVHLYKHSFWRVMKSTLDNSLTCIVMHNGEGEVAELCSLKKRANRY